MPNSQRGACLNFAYFSMQFYNPGDPKWGAMAQRPPPNTPLFTDPKRSADPTLGTTGLVVHQHMNSHTAILAAHPNLQTAHEGNFCSCHRTLFSDYSNQSLTTRSPERGFSTSITLALHLAQSHCACITKRGLGHYI